MKIGAALDTSAAVSASKDIEGAQSRGLRRTQEIAAAGLICAAVIAGAVLRSYHLNAQSLWLDEGYTLLQSSLSIPNLIGFARTETYPPLYPLLQHAWGVLFGDSESALRGLSALCGVLSLPLFYLLARKLLKDSWAVALATCLFAFSTVQVWYSREARPYELCSFLALVSLYALVLFLEHRSAASFALIVLSSAASLYSHNMMFFYFFALNLAWLLFPSERAWTQRIKEVLLADFLAALLYLPWLPSLFSQMSRVQGSFWIRKPTISTLFHTASFLSGFNEEYLSALSSRLLPLSAHAVWICVLSGLTLLCAAMVASGLWRASAEGRRQVLSLLIYAILPVLAVFVLSQLSRPLFVDRVFISSSIAIPIILAYPLALQKGRKARMLYGLLGIVLAAATAVSVFGYLRYHQKEDWRGASQSLLRIPENDRLIVFAPTIGKILYGHYARGNSGPNPGVETMGLPKSLLEEFPPRIGALSGPTDIGPIKNAVQSRSYSEVDLVLADESPLDLNESALSYMNENFALEQEQHFHGIRVLRFSARSR